MIGCIAVKLIDKHVVERHAEICKTFMKRSRRLGRHTARRSGRRAGRVADEEEALTLQLLPDEVIQEILFWLGPTELIAVSAVSRRMLAVSDWEPLWAAAAAAASGSSAVGGKSDRISRVSVVAALKTWLARRRSKISAKWTRVSSGLRLPTALGKLESMLTPSYRLYIDGRRQTRSQRVGRKGARRHGARFAAVNCLPFEVDPRVVDRLPMGAMSLRVDVVLPLLTPKLAGKETVFTLARCQLPSADKWVESARGERGQLRMFNFHAEWPSATSITVATWEEGSDDVAFILVHVHLEDLRRVALGKRRHAQSQFPADEGDRLTRRQLQSSV
eukprot:PLAT11391.2.p1 GENE.PLAT11391.2~~PLAT11391.2.p1  ORF type:complete len:332 (-),score=100.22 PLAT11391.2:666-1661(-)